MKGVQYIFLLNIRLQLFNNSHHSFSELLSIIHTNYNRILITGCFNLHVDNSSDPLSSKIDDIRSSILLYRNDTSRISGQLLLPEETLEFCPG